MQIKVTLVGGSPVIDPQQVFEIENEDSISVNGLPGWVTIELKDGGVVYFPQQDVFSLVIRGGDGRP